ncbi:Uncharacterized protein dnl_22140 [Desulfonema limicola]|uniref:Uncharacterized protein n=1 Tax=Desulfonema limicola TaxID=45656 RepID=A0A975GG53_9BACT|nr:hypothetical protein [Desulfonema limicola]QTA79932.1 Uncharacterized protein dnl_22140 [Desulfonema limicola]
MKKCLILYHTLIFLSLNILIGYNIGYAESNILSYPASISLSENDSDQDGLPDYWEQRFSGTSTGLKPDEDNDNDELKNYDEFKYGTHPFEPDSDGDGLTDGQEVQQYGTNPVMEDSDQGGKPDGYEVFNGSSPLDPGDDDNSSSMIVNIQLKQGWNLISLPVSPVSKSISDVLSSISDAYSSVWSYQNNNWKMYNPARPTFSDLTLLDAGWGYWINMERPAALNIAGTSAPKSIHLNKGWNLAGYNLSADQTPASVFSSIYSKINTVWMYKNSQWDSYNASKPGFSDLEIMEPKYGYWIYTKDECDWNF